MRWKDGAGLASAIGCCLTMAFGMWNSQANATPPVPDSAAPAAPGWTNWPELDGWTGWTQNKVKGDITIYEKRMEGQEVLGFGGETILEVDIETACSVIGDFNNYPAWMKYNILSQPLSGDGEIQGHLYMVFDPPFPLSDRDYMTWAYRDSHPSGLWILGADSLESELDKKEDCCVRAVLYAAFFLEDLGNNQTRIVVKVITDLRGALPGWLKNLIAEDWPTDTLSGIQQRLASGQTQQHAQCLRGVFD
ncbi:MAG: hypothetical protein ACI8RZ_005291 [Myxococcota bacterium]|jgi:hypothetical protein